MGRYQDIDRYVVSLIEQSSPERTVWNVEKLRDGIPANWNYVDGCMMNALLSMARITGESRYFRFVDSFIDSFVLEDGSIAATSRRPYFGRHQRSRVLFELYEKTGKEKYKKAADFLKQRLLEHPAPGRAASGTSRFTQPGMLDGVYMAQPFAACMKNTSAPAIMPTLSAGGNRARRMRDEKTGLYYHGYDASKTAFWCDQETGLSRCFWLRAIGWFSVALADLAEILPNGSERDKIADVFARLMADIAPFAAPDTGMYYQVVDQAGREGNYQESSGSSMIAYAMLKGARLGVLDKKFAPLQENLRRHRGYLLEFADGSCA
jgi:unsaturated rhamnogalacturonyl hydrolase